MPEQTRLISDKSCAFFCFPKLPSELQTKIIKFAVEVANREALKRNRHVSRSFHDPATQILFSTIHLSLNQLSYERMEQVALSATLSVHVREIVLHRGSFSGPWYQPDHYIVPSLEEFTGRCKTQTGSILPEKMYAYYYEAFKEEVESERHFFKHHGAHWLLHLTHSVYLKFSRLEKLTLPPEISSYITHSHYLCKKVRLQHGQYNNEDPVLIGTMLGLIQVPKLRYLSARDCISRGYPNIKNVPDEMQDCLPYLSLLEELTWTFHAPNTVARFDILDNRGLHDIWRPFWDNCRNLRLVEVGLEHSFPVHESFARTFVDGLLETQLLRLREVRLHHLVATEASLVKFLVAHAQVLERFTLQNWYLSHGDEDEEGLGGSYIRAFWKIGRMDSKLKAVSLCGQFIGNLQVKGWRAVRLDNEDEDRCCVRSRLEEYMCQRGPFPLYDRFQATKQDLEALDTAPEQRAFADKSWVYQNQESNS